MLKAIRVYGDSSAETLTFRLRGATPKDTYLLRDASGLTPPAKNLFISDLARDGSLYKGRRVGNRNIVLTFDLNPDPSLGENIAKLRDRVQRVVMGSSAGLQQESAVHVELSYESGEDRYASGHLDTFETGLFTDENLVQISILCPDPYLYNAPVHMVRDPMTEAGSIILPISYPGTADTGFDTTVLVEANGVTKLSLAVNEQTMEFSYPFVKGDRVRVGTHPDNRFARITNRGVGDSTSTNLLPYLDPRSRWLTLGVGVETMSVFGENPGQFVAAIYELSYRPNYWGI